ncbi:hypothetical protein [Nocardia sp. NPDC059239]|uniref:hypothetical protein n=1 Tax=unclassified Nocardia TaxID=2637762 RepID=UPI003679F630
MTEIALPTSAFGPDHTGITNDEVVTLLQKAVIYDNRDVDQLLVDAWLDAGRRQHWTFDEAEEAIQQHYSASTAWIMPGHITQIIKNENRRWYEQ